MRLFLLFKQEQVDSLAFWFGVVPLALVLAVVYLIAWTTYRTSRRAVSPVIWLARQVEQWDPKRPTQRAEAARTCPCDVEGETLTLASSLHDFASPHRPLRRARAQLHPRRLARIAHAADRDPRRRRHDGRRRDAVAGVAPLAQAHPGGRPRHGGADRSLPDPGARRRHRPAGRRLLASAKWPARKSTRRGRCSAASRSSCELRQEAELRTACAGARALGACSATCCATPATTPTQGSIIVTVRRASVVVSDTGVGMSAEELARAFEPFYRAGDRARTGRASACRSCVGCPSATAGRCGWRASRAREPRRPSAFLQSA